jgi:hypothetical protein
MIDTDENAFLLTLGFPHTGEQGKVEESMREMAAIEALKNEKGEKEASLFLPLLHYSERKPHILA